MDESERASIIQAVKTPLGFFTVTVLIVEGILGLLASRASGWDFSALLGSMIVLIFALVACVAFIVLRRPDLLLGVDAVSSNQTRMVADELKNARTDLQTAQSAAAKWEQEAGIQRAQVSALDARLASLDSLKKRVWALVHHSDSVSLAFILTELNAADDTHARNEVLATLGDLIDEGRVERAFSTGHYKAAAK